MSNELREPDISRTEVSQMISRATGLPPELRGMSDFAGQIYNEINRSPSLMRMAQSGNITSYIIGNLPPEISAQIDSSRREALLKELKRDNVTSSGFANALADLNFSRYAHRQGNMAMHGRDGEGSSARYDSIASGSWESPAGMAQMREFAMHSGIGWAANNPELLRMGPAALQTLADAHMREQTFREMSKARFEGKNIVAIAAFANATHRDANKLGHDLAESNTQAATDKDGKVNQDVLLRLQNMQGAYAKAMKDNPNNEEAGRKYDAEAAAIKEKLSPEQTKAVDQGSKALGRKAEETHGKELKADAKIAQDQDTKKANRAAMAKATASLGL